MAARPTVTDLAKLRGLWLRPGLRPLKSLREVSLRRKPRDLTPLAWPLMLVSRSVD
jgi:hypothetical protein